MSDDTKKEKTAIEQAREVLEAEKNERILACRKKIEEVLKEFNCTLQISNPTVTVVAK